MIDNGFPAQSQCSNISVDSLRTMNWIRVSASAGGFLIVAVILVAVLVRREYKSVMQRMFIYLLVATLMHQTVLVANVEHQFQYHGMDEVCGILGVLNFDTSITVIMFVTATITYLLGRVVHEWKRSKAFTAMFEFGFVLLTFLVPLIVCVGLLYTDIWGLSTAWCWIRKYDSHCDRVDNLGIVLGGHSIIVITGILCIVLTTTIIVIYLKLARQRIKQAAQLMKPAVILITCFIVNLFIFIFSLIVSAIPLHVAVVYTYAVVISLCDLIYPLGFLISLKFPAVMTYIRRRKQRPMYSLLPKSNYGATVPPSNRVSAGSITLPITAPYTGQFTTISSEVY